MAMPRFEATESKRRGNAPVWFLRQYLTNTKRAMAPNTIPTTEPMITGSNTLLPFKSEVSPDESCTSSVGDRVNSPLVAGVDVVGGTSGLPTFLKRKERENKEKEKQILVLLHCQSFVRGQELRNISRNRIILYITVEINREKKSKMRTEMRVTNNRSPYRNIKLVICPKESGISEM